MCRYIRRWEREIKWSPSVAFKHIFNGSYNNLYIYYCKNSRNVNIIENNHEIGLVWQNLYKLLQIVIRNRINELKLVFCYFVV